MCSGENGVDALLAMGEVDANAIFPVEMLGEVLGAIDGAMLTTCAAEGEHEVGEAALEVTLNMMIGEAIDAVEEGEDLAVVLKEADDGSVQAGELLVGLVAAGVVGGAAVEDVAAAIAGGVVGYSLLIAEAVDGDGEGVSLLYLPLRGEDSGARVPSLEGRVRERLSVYYLIEHLLQIGIAVCCAGGEQLP